MNKREKYNFLHLEKENWRSPIDIKKHINFINKKKTTATRITNNNTNPNIIPDPHFLQSNKQKKTKKEFHLFFRFLIGEKN